MNEILPTNVIIISHGEIGQHMFDVVIKTYGKLPIPTKILSVHYAASVQSVIDNLSEYINSIAKHSAILILTDLIGSTPSNVAVTFSKKTNIKIVSGLNLPMLMRVMNYPELSLEELAEKAISGGREGIGYCK